MTFKTLVPCLTLALWVACTPHEAGKAAERHAAGKAVEQHSGGAPDVQSPTGSALRVVLVLRAQPAPIPDPMSPAFLRSLAVATGATEVQYASPVYGPKHVFYFTLGPGQDTAALLAALRSLPTIESAELDERAKAH